MKPDPMTPNDSTLSNAALHRFAKQFAAVSSTDRKMIHRLLLVEMKQHPREVTDNRDCLGARLTRDEKAMLKNLAFDQGETVSDVIRKALRSLLKTESPTP